jgi:16S rRNA (uracil1498-N3)-methyltransferase
MRIYVCPADIAKVNNIKLSSDKSHYLLSVLRLKEGDNLEIIDGKGKAYNANIVSIVKNDVYVGIASQIPVDTEPAVHIVLCQSILKGDKMEIVIQKAVELGVSEIIPLITERCLVRTTRKTGRWRKIAEEAAEQCCRAVVPFVHESMTLNELSGQGKVNGFVFWEEGGSPPAGVAPAHEKVYLLIGPEGGLAENEVKTAESFGLIRTSLGKRVLRADTAAIVALALVQHMPVK